VGRTATSSSHALIGGVAGAGLAYKGAEVIQWSNIWKRPSSFAGAAYRLAIGFAVMIGVYWLFRRWRPADVDKIFRKGQLISAALYSLGHGGNDAQKTMGIIMRCLSPVGVMNPDETLSLTNPRTLWIILSCHLAMGWHRVRGWRIVKTMG